MEIGSQEWGYLGLFVGIAFMCFGAFNKELKMGLWGFVMTVYVLGKYFA